MRSLGGASRDARPQHSPGRLDAPGQLISLRATRIPFQVNDFASLRAIIILFISLFLELNKLSEHLYLISVSPKLTELAICKCNFLYSQAVIA